MGETLLNTSNLIFTLLTLLILARVVLSWVVSSGTGQLRDNAIVIMIFQLSEPILRPFQRLIPPMGMMDFSPVVAIVVLQIVQVIVGQIIVSAFPY